MSELVAKEKEVTLLDLLDRALNKGVFVQGDITIPVADVDLIYVGLKVLLASVETAERMRSAAAGQPFDGLKTSHDSRAKNPAFLKRIPGQQTVS
ncbi:MAG: gas vesicle protein [Chloroflexi bacterium]|nr:gas vesicle protein [Chloroflexota bacterium]